MTMPRIGHRVVGTVKSAKGSCTVGHKVGDKFELSIHNPDGLCGFFYHDCFPLIMMLQFGGGYPAEWGDPEVIERECTDLYNTIRIELRRVRE